MAATLLSNISVDRNDVSTDDAMNLASAPPQVAVDDTDGNEFVNTGDVYILFDNGAGTGATVEFNITDDQSCDGQVEGRTKDYAIAANEKKLVGPFPQNVYNSRKGRCLITYSGDTTNLNVAALKMDIK